MRRPRRWLALAFIVGVSVAAGIYAWRSGATPVDEARVKTATVTRQTIERTVIATGVIRPVVGAEVNVGSRVSGTVVELPVRVGDRVTEGQVLARLDATPFEAALDEARAELAVDVPRVALAESTLRRRRSLAVQGLLSEEDLEIATRNLDMERARLEASEARVRSAEIMLGYTRITAPIGGVIAEVSTREGETVAAGLASPTFVTIVDLDHLEVLAYVDETDIGRIHVGQEAVFTVDTFADEELSARVVAIQPQAESQGSVINYVVRLEYERREALILRPEMTAHVRLQVEARRDVLTLPRNALRRENARETVVTRSGDEWLPREVSTGWRSDSFVEIESGLREGDVVQINPQ